jgi:hypothetical protein
MKCKTYQVSKAVDSDSSLRYRIGFAILAGICLSVLVVAAFLKPNPHGLGTHTQLGKPACGFYKRTGYPCPTCGMTTAFAHTVRGQLFQAFAVQPAGALAALLCVAGVVGGMYITFTGRRIDHYLIRINWMLCFFLAAVLVLASWGWLCLLTYIQKG